MMIGTHVRNKLANQAFGKVTLRGFVQVLPLKSEKINDGYIDINLMSFSSWPTISFNKILKYTEYFHWESQCYNI